MARFKVNLFLEDAAHEAFIPPLFKRILRENGLPLYDVELLTLHSRGGKSLEAFREFVEDAKRSRHLAADLLLVGADADEAGFIERRKYILNFAEKSPFSVVVPVIPIPYIERWYFLDVEALSNATGISVSPICLTAPGDKHHYRTLLRNVLAEIRPPLGGIEYGEKVANTMNLYEARKHDTGLDYFIRETTSWAKSL